jgi:hypothetical protein
MEKMISGSLIPVSVNILEKLKKEFDDLLIELHELCNGSISPDTDLYLEYEPDPESDGSTLHAVPYLISIEPETLGAWKSRLKLLRSNLHFDSDAVAIINKKLEELYEIRCL